MAVVSMKCGLLPLTRTTMRFFGHLGFHDYFGPALDLAERQSIVARLGPLTGGAKLPQAFNSMCHLEGACRAQVDAMAARTELSMPGEDILQKTAHLYQPGTRRPYGVLEWHALLRLLEAEQKNDGFPPYWS